MPCRSDYFEIIPRGYRQVDVVNQRFKDFADSLTCANDLIREYIIGEEGASEAVSNMMSMEASQDIALQKLKENYVQPSAGIISHCEELLKTFKWLCYVVNNRDATAISKVKKDQTKHRKSDIDRLMKTFANSG